MNKELLIDIVNKYPRDTRYWFDDHVVEYFQMCLDKKVLVPTCVADVVKWFERQASNSRVNTDVTCYAYDYGLAYETIGKFVKEELQKIKLDPKLQ